MHDTDRAVSDGPVSAAGLGPHDSIKFSKGILRGGAPVTHDDLFKAKITYIFSDGYATTSNLGTCPAGSLPLISSSWRPDLTVSPRIVKKNILRAVLLSPDTSQVASIIGYAYLNNPSSTNAVIGFPHGPPDVTFSVPAPSTLLALEPSPAASFVSTAVPQVTATRRAAFDDRGRQVLAGSTTALASNISNTVFEFTRDRECYEWRVFPGGP